MFLIIHPHVLPQSFHPQSFHPISGTQPSLLPNCHHQIIYAKFNLKILYPLPYTWKIWHYEDSNDDFSNQERVFENKNMVRRILTNLIPYILIVCEHKDLRWFNSKINSLLYKKTKICKVSAKSFGIIIKMRN